MPLSDLLVPAQEAVSPLGRYRVLSKLAGVKVSPLVLGGMSIGQAWNKEISNESQEKDSFALLDAFVAAGGNFIDTANNYQDEQSEAWIGKWMTARGNRDQLIISTKYTSNYKTWELGKTGKALPYGGNSRKSMHVSVRDSLKKLQTDYIDLLFVHWWDWSTSITEVMDGLHVLVQQGKVLYLGASDLPAWVVATANAYAIAHGKTPFSVYQGPWNLVERDLEIELLPLCRHYGMAVMPWSAMGGGHFKTKAEIEARERAGKPLRSFFGGLTPADHAISAALDEVAGEIATARAGAKPAITAVALAWILHKAPYVFPLVGGTSVQGLQQNIEALQIQLTDDQVQRLESVVPSRPSLLYMMMGVDPGLTGSHPLVDAMAPIAYVEAQKAIRPA